MPQKTQKPDRTIRFRELNRSMKLQVIIRSFVFALAAVLTVNFLVDNFLDPNDEMYRGHALYFAAGYLIVFIIAGLLISIYERNKAGAILQLERNSTVDSRTNSRLLAAVENIREAVIAVDPEGKIVYMNPSAESFTGWCFSCAENRYLNEILTLADPESGLPIVFSNISQNLQNRNIHQNRRVIVISQTGKETPAEEKISAVSDDEGTYSGSILILRDAGEQLLNDDVIEFAGIGLMQYTIDGTIVKIDRGTLRILDLEEMYPDPAMAIGKGLSELITYSRSLRKVQREILRRGIIRGLEYSIVTLKGDIKWLRHDSRMTTDSASGEKLVRVIVRDITERKAAQYELEEKSFYLDNILSSYRDSAVIATDKVFGIKYFNNAAEKTFGVTARSIVGNSLVDLHALDKMDLTSFDKAIEAVKYGNDYTYRVVRRIGREKRIIEATVSGMHHQSHQLAGYIITARDITEREPVKQFSGNRKMVIKKSAESSRNTSEKEIEEETAVPV